jgi:hypothetical protein
VDRFADSAEQFDDITMLCLEYRGMGKTTMSQQMSREENE